MQGQNTVLFCAAMQSCAVLLKVSNFLLSIFKAIYLLDKKQSVEAGTTTVFIIFPMQLLYSSSTLSQTKKFSVQLESKYVVYCNIFTAGY